MAETSVRRPGALLLIDRLTGKLTGIFTDADLRRHVLEDSGAMSRRIADVMTPGRARSAILRCSATPWRMVREFRRDEIPRGRCRGATRGASGCPGPHRHEAREGVDRAMVAPQPPFHPVSLLVLDVDGVMSDGGIYVDQDGREIKRYDVTDGLGIKIWLKTWASGGSHHRPRWRHCRTPGPQAWASSICAWIAMDKGAALVEALKRTGITAAGAAFLGDDLARPPRHAAGGLPHGCGQCRPPREGDRQVRHATRRRPWGRPRGDRAHPRTAGPTGAGGAPVRSAAWLGVLPPTESSRSAPPG